MKTWKSHALPQLPGVMPAIHLHETTAQRVVLLPETEPASLYVCGITPYDATHMGHAATYVAFDLLNRAWRDQDRTVNYVQNVTDIDDPLLERAIRDGVDWQELAIAQTELFHADMEALNVLAPEHYIGAVESISWIVPEVEKLIAAGLAYPVVGSEGEPDGDIYFSVEAASSAAKVSGPDAPWWLGQISGLTQEEMVPIFAERGGDPLRAGKRHPLDALLWRVARDGEPSWEGASLGEGRPGWHIECTVIAQRFLPKPFTVQGGGSDLVFPHHEMGAGHAFALEDTTMARHYTHTGMVGLDGEKMSKSRGNLVLVSKLRAAGVEPAAIRLAILAHHYRSDWFWTQELLDDSEYRLERWRKARHVAPEGSAKPLLSELRSALSQDLDAPRAVAAIDAWATASLTAALAASINVPVAVVDGVPEQVSARDSDLVSDAVEALLGIEL
ncbi:L-cysteine:1D-myo-inositol 2-amino-2-deoxy-alpha-D-glucopyranoside ligase [Arthrobacter alpinus]|uniref:L-cysteine:1D-myo-inositol 2-amino-2-deoxy-alpha-D-glucopyranoside ligase n=1 Tax=Arthrobacter alpinus TaxID=656366 RepID=A0A1H5IZP0_9MICC|nr:cysteine--1-D-myo-inosityl 2-amino-2-deoxy-alpha-D-glucopyranoside ligase [Arthrobacter alpinus]SEE45753.1 L-cysteine:1D-myo-inositol 2-amino-2-deoxy-alpha-D-glucopyranoside ligase [Arthrobacter alpinus]